MSISNSVFPGNVADPCTNNSTSDIRIRRRRRRSHVLTRGAMRGCGLPSLMVCINGITCDIRETNVTKRSEIWTKNIRSLGFWNVREWHTLRELILWILGCIYRACQWWVLWINNLVCKKKILLSKNMPSIMCFNLQSTCWPHIV